MMGKHPQMTGNYEWAGPNANVAKVLNKYCYEDTKIPFALMLNGAWGCGKTWFVKRFFEEKQKERRSDSELGMIYVSLYGIQDAEEITKAIYAAMHPLLGGKVGELGKVIFKGLLKSTLKIDLHHLENGKADLSAGIGFPEKMGSRKNGKVGLLDKIRFHKKSGNKNRIFKNRILVLDDMERAKMPVSDILALVQPLVESLEDRVILIANEKEISSDNNEEKDPYKRIKEKTVYLTLSLNPDIESAWKDIQKQLPEGPFKAFLADRTEDFVSFIKGTEQQNFRLLYFFINFGKDLFPNFNTKEKQKNDNIVFDILCLLYGLIVEKMCMREHLLKLNQ